MCTIFYTFYKCVQYFTLFTNVYNIVHIYLSYNINLFSQFNLQCKIYIDSRMETCSIILAKMGRDQDERVIEYVIGTYISTFYIPKCFVGLWGMGTTRFCLDLELFFGLQLKLFLYCLYNNLIYNSVRLKNTKIFLLVTP